jgi:hypothetical protein
LQKPAEEVPLIRSKRIVRFGVFHAVEDLGQDSLGRLGVSDQQVLNRFRSAILELIIVVFVEFEDAVDDFHSGRERLIVELQVDVQLQELKVRFRFRDRTYLCQLPAGFLPVTAATDDT